MIPRTTVDNERAFSAVSNFLIDKRTRMNDSTLNALNNLFFMKDYFKCVDEKVKLSKRSYVQYDQLIDHSYEQLIDHSSRGRMIN